jgi:hypothetical protein
MENIIAGIIDKIVETNDFSNINDSLIQNQYSFETSLKYINSLLTRDNMDINTKTKVYTITDKILDIYNKRFNMSDINIVFTLELLKKMAIHKNINFDGYTSKLISEACSDEILDFVASIDTQHILPQLLQRSNNKQLEILIRNSKIDYSTISDVNLKTLILSLVLKKKHIDNNTLSTLLAKHNLLCYIFFMDLDRSDIKSYVYGDKVYYRILDKYDMLADVSNISFDLKDTGVYITTVTSIDSKNADILVSIVNVELTDRLLNFLLKHRVTNIFKNICSGSENNISTFYWQFYSAKNKYSEKHILSSKTISTIDIAIREILRFEYDMEKLVNYTNNAFTFCRSIIDDPDSGINHTSIKCFIDVPYLLPNANVYNMLLPGTIINRSKSEIIICSHKPISIISFELTFDTNSAIFMIDSNKVFLPYNTSFRVSGEIYKNTMSMIIIPIVIQSQKIHPYSPFTPEEKSNIYSNFLDYFDQNKLDRVIDSINTGDLSNYTEKITLCREYMIEILILLDKKYSTLSDKFVRKLLDKFTRGTLDINAPCSDQIIFTNPRLAFIYIDYFYGMDITIANIMNFINIYTSVDNVDYTLFLDIFLSNVYRSHIVLKTLKIKDTKVLGSLTLEFFILQLFKQRPQYFKILAKHGYVYIDMFQPITQRDFLASGLIQTYVHGLTDNPEYLFATNYKINSCLLIKVQGKSRIRINNKYDIEYSQDSVKYVLHKDYLFFLPSIKKVTTHRVLIVGETSELAQPIFKVLRKFCVRLDSVKVVETDDNSIYKYYSCFGDTIYKDTFVHDFNRLLDLTGKTETELSYIMSNTPDSKVSELVLCSAFIVLNYYTGDSGYKTMNALLKGVDIHSPDFDKDIKIGSMVTYSPLARYSFKNDIERKQTIICLNNFIWRMCKKFRQTEKIPPCLLSRKLILYRGENNISIPLTNGSIINALRNKFLSFTTSFSTARSFSDDIIYMIEVDINKDIFLPIGSIKFKGMTLSQEAYENEFLFPINTSFIVVDTPKSVTQPGYRPFAVLPIKIHNQSKPNFTEFVNSPLPRPLFTQDELENEYHNVFTSKF